MDYSVMKTEEQKKEQEKCPSHTRSCCRPRPVQGSAVCQNLG